MNERSFFDLITLEIIFFLKNTSRCKIQRIVEIIIDAWQQINIGKSFTIQQHFKEEM